MDISSHSNNVTITYISILADCNSVSETRVTFFPHSTCYISPHLLWLGEILNNIFSPSPIKWGCYVTIPTKTDDLMLRNLCFCYVTFPT